MERVLYIVKIS